MMTLGTFCSGMGAPEAAAMGKPLWQAEIDNAASNFLAQKFPDVPNLGDMTAPDLVERIVEIGIPDLVVAGLPCQPFSVAGLRKGEEDPRNLTVRFVEIMDAVDDIRRRSGQPPVWWLVENVPGLLSDKNNAFGALLAGMVAGNAALVPNGRWSNAGVVSGPRRGAAWRVLDAQYFGVAQRRRRVFILARGGAGNFDCADALLPVTDSMSWHPAPRREEGQSVAAFTASRLGDYREGVGTLRANGGDLAGGSETLIAAEKWPADVAPTLNAHFGDKMGLEDQHALNGAGLFVPAVVGALTAKGPTGLGAPEVDAGHIIPAVASVTGDRTHALTAASHSGATEDGTGRGVPVVAFAQNSRDEVRRLTPTECLRLQGFPDDWFDGIEYQGKPLADGPKYKMIGNSMAVPVMAHIGQRIRAVHERSEAA